MSTYQLIFGKACNLPIELEHRALMALQKLNLNLNKIANLRVDQINQNK